MIDSLLPLNDSWEGVGGIAVWDDASTWPFFVKDGFYYHSTGVGSLVNILNDFRKSTKKGNQGSGTKTPNDGSFPDGDFTWTYKSVD